LYHFYSSSLPNQHISSNLGGPTDWICKIDLYL